MWKYIIPVLITVIVSLFMYFISADEKKNKPEKIIFRNVFPGIIVGLLVFVIIKYKDSNLFNQEPLMKGTFFE
jgi:RsiW-degrading membrane proteinase PrsW (M82 family)